MQPSACAADFVHSETVSFLCVSHKSMGQFMAAARKTLSPNAIQLFHYSNGMSGLCPFDAGTGNNENTCTQSLSDSNERFFFRFSIELHSWYSPVNRRVIQFVRMHNGATRLVANTL